MAKDISISKTSVCKSSINLEWTKKDVEITLGLHSCTGLY